MDITSEHLDAAVIDQAVAGEFSGKRYAFIAARKQDAHILGVAVADEVGWSPVEGKQFGSRDAAQDWADRLNTHIGLTTNEAVKIITSSMFKGFVHA